MICTLIAKPLALAQQPCMRAQLPEMSGCGSYKLECRYFMTYHNRGGAYNPDIDDLSEYAEASQNALRILSCFSLLITSSRVYDLT